VFDAVAIAGSATKLVYAKLHTRQFTAVNTTKGPWALLDALQYKDRRHKTRLSDDSTVTSLYVGKAPAPFTREPQSLNDVTEVVRNIAANLIGYDSFEGETQILITDPVVGTTMN